MLPAGGRSSKKKTACSVGIRFLGLICTYLYTCLPQHLLVVAGEVLDDLLRGTIVIRTYGMHKNLPGYIINHFY